MKPKLTTSGTALIRQVQLELNQPYSEKCSLLFSVCPALGIGHCSVQFIEEQTPFLIVREWRPERQELYPTGIYDLNTIYIAEKRIALSTTDSVFIRSIKNVDLKIEKSTNIMLDGASYTLVLDDQTIHWTLIDKLSPELQESLNKLIHVAGIGL